MTKLFDELQTFMKAQGIRNPKGLATYVATRYYGVATDPKERSDEDKEEIDKIAFGITDKRDAKIWNPIMSNTGDKPDKKYLAGLSTSEKKNLKENRADDKEKKRGNSEKDYQKNRNTTGRHNARFVQIAAAKKKADKAAKKAGNSPTEEEAGTLAPSKPRKPSERRRQTRAASEQGNETRRTNQEARNAAGGKAGGTVGGRTANRRPEPVANSLDLYKGPNWSLPKSDEFDADPIAFASNVMRDKKGFSADDLHSGEEGAKRRNKLAQKVRRLVLNVADSPDKKENLKAAKETDLKKGAFKDLAGLVAALGGWAISDDVVRAGGGSPRGEMTAAQQREWSRLVNRAMTRKNTEPSKLEDLKGYWTDKANTYRKSKPIENSLLIKDHAVSPPKQGLVWDAVKHRWTNPKNVGRSVVEVQGKKRIRASGVGAHSHSIKPGQVGGRGEGSAKEGRVARSEVDVSTPIDARSQSATKGKELSDKLEARLKQGLRGIKTDIKEREATKKRSELKDKRAAAKKK
jgi:hypothetical protein